MKRAMTLWLAGVCLLTTACGGSSGAGKLRIEEAPASVTEPCGRPEKYLTAQDWELIAGRIGDELIECGKKHSILVERDRYVVDVLKGRDYWSQI